ncbi:hypothetical protein [Agrococcus sp. ARC_14]|uniref:hypothetical protein n=1 Tax=Agrococcus sp. ARC_14 TaxID=2919927 RepID=UPI001F06BE15|nr:hypothetical protein [Agrococcus sp. ARC_14]MCH1881831.1 hypothetical protein [Agrococcus sp. ARC_14]
MTDPRDPVDASGAPPPPGADTPVPADAAARAAAAGRARQLAEPSAPRPDGLVPSTAIENRAQDRARARKARLGLGGARPQQVENPGVGMPGQILPPGLMPAMAESMPQRFVPAGWQVQNPAAAPQPQPYGAAPYGAAPYGAAPYGAAPYGQAPYGAAPYGAAPYGTAPYGQAPYGQAPYGQAPYGQAPYGPAPYGALPYGAVSYGAAPYQPQAPMLPPRIPWTGRQRSAAVLSSWLGQTVMALATHLLTAFFLILSFALLLHLSGDAGDFEADSFTSILARWSMPDRVWATALIGLLIGGGMLAGGWLLHALWAKTVGLAKPHRSTWLAWLCTTAATGIVGMALWPFALIGGFVVVLAASDASLTTGTMWEVLFWELGVAALLTGGVGLLFGWLFLSQARLRVDYRALAEAEEAAARARDEAELTQVRLRGEASSSTMRPQGGAAAGDATASGR